MTTSESILWCQSSAAAGDTNALSADEYNARWLRFMRKTLFIIFLTAIGFSLAHAQDKPKPNLAGKWVVDFTKSEKTSNFFEDSELWMIIEQHEPEIRMTRKFESLSETLPF